MNCSVTNHHTAGAMPRSSFSEWMNALIMERYPPPLRRGRWRPDPMSQADSPLSPACIESFNACQRYNIHTLVSFTCAASQSIPPFLPGHPPSLCSHSQHSDVLSASQVRVLLDAVQCSVHSRQRGNLTDEEAAEAGTRGRQQRQPVGGGASLQPSSGTAQRPHRERG